MLRLGGVAGLKVDARVCATGSAGEGSRPLARGGRSRGYGCARAVLLGILAGNDVLVTGSVRSGRTY